MMSVGALYEGYGTHYVDIWIGTPPQRQTVIVDTGSSVAAFPCAPGCDDEDDSCGLGYHIDLPFPTSTSSTFQVVHCKECQLTGACRSNSHGGYCPVSVRYMEGSSWSAFEALDWIYLGGLHDHPLTIQQETSSQQQKFGQDEEIAVEAFQPNPSLNETHSQQTPDAKQQDMLLVDAAPQSQQQQKQQDSTSTNGEDPSSAVDFRFPLHFGCQTELTGLFQTQLADGIMGMENTNVAAWKQATNYLGLNPSFSLCFSHPSHNAQNETAGALTLGGVDGNLHYSHMVYAKNIHSSGWYGVQVTRLYWINQTYSDVDDDDDDMTTDSAIVPIDSISDIINAGGNGVIVDSGTTDTFLDKRLFQPLKTAWEQLSPLDFPWSNDNDGKRYSFIYLTDDELFSLPTLIVQLAGYDSDDNENDDDDDLYANQDEIPPIVSLAGPDFDTERPNDVLHRIPPWRYLGLASESSPAASSFVKTHKKRNSQRLFRTRIHLERSSQGGVLGANSMSGHDIHFDAERGRIGFANSFCDYDTLTESFRTKKKRQ